MNQGEKKRVLFVCLGNICRSPMAEGICLDLLKTEFNDLNLEVDSAGTGDYHVGELPDQRMRETALSHGIKLTSRARQIKSSDLNEFDFIIAMDQANLSNILAIAPERYTAQTFLMRTFENSDEINVPDPYFGGKSGFENVFNILETSVRNFLESIRTNQI